MFDASFCLDDSGGGNGDAPVLPPPSGNGATGGGQYACLWGVEKKGMNVSVAVQQDLITLALK